MLKTFNLETTGTEKTCERMHALYVKFAFTLKNFKS